MRQHCGDEPEPSNHVDFVVEFRTFVRFRYQCFSSEMEDAFDLVLRESAVQIGDVRNVPFYKWCPANKALMTGRKVVEDYGFESRRLQCLDGMASDVPGSSRYKNQPDLLYPLDNHRDSLAAPNTERSQSAVHIAAMHLVYQCRQDPRPTGTDRMTQRHGAAIDVDAIGIQFEFSSPQRSIERQMLRSVQTNRYLTPTDRLSAEPSSRRARGPFPCTTDQLRPKRRRAPRPAA